MSKTPPKDEPGADERFQRGIENALKMPAKPHKPPQPAREPGGEEKPSRRP